MSKSNLASGSKYKSGSGSGASSISPNLSNVEVIKYIEGTRTATKKIMKDNPILHVAF